MPLSQTYLKYGFPSPIANLLEQKGISLTAFRTLSQKLLMKELNVDRDTIKLFRSYTQREPVDDNTLFKLLKNNNFLCCICKGTKSDGVVVHHIRFYSDTRDNSYKNLALLCPNDHDLAHREGIALTNKITATQIRKFKTAWERDVRKNNRARSLVLKSEWINVSTRNFESKKIDDNEKHDVDVNHVVNASTRLFLIVDTTLSTQEFVVYLSLKTSANRKWIGFGTPNNLKNGTQTEMVFRVGRPVETHYEFVEHIWERINESGLQFGEGSIVINKIRFWGWHNNNEIIDFKFKLID